jgi:hypothetical protein
MMTKQVNVEPHGAGRLERRVRRCKWIGCRNRVKEDGIACYLHARIEKKHACPMLEITPITLDEANAFVARNHRHHNPVVGHKFSIAVSSYGEGDDQSGICGVCIVGRPVARHLDDGWTLEVTRCCTDGTKNACSMLYGAAWRAAKAMGYRRLITYTLPEEGGASLRAAGWTLLGKRGGGNWNVPSRPRIDTDAALRGQKLLWEAV